MEITLPQAEEANPLEEIKQIEQRKRELVVQEQLAINKALNSNDPAAIVKAMDVVKIHANKTDNNRKGIVLDPRDFNESFGYRHKPSNMSYELLDNMSHVPVIRAILTTRKNQIAAFATPQPDRYSSGFIIEKKASYWDKKRKPKLSKEDYRMMDEITDFILNCGTNNSWSRVGFEQFMRLTVEDSLKYDQVNFEVVRDPRGRLFEITPLDPATIRIADSYDDEEYKGSRKQVGGYYPSYVQIMDEIVHAEFYPWELAFGIRNPSTMMKTNGYGRSELEDMVNVITSMLWSDEYNRNFFKQGSVPKGLIKIKPGVDGGISWDKLEEFKRSWQAMMAGVWNSWKTPIMEADMDYIDLQKSNTDMGWQNWNEFLIKLACALYTIDPTEIGFNSGNSVGQTSMFEKGNAQNLKYSKDKGLKPLLKFKEAWLNQMVVSQLNPDFRLRFVGLDLESEEERRSRKKDEVGNWKTLNEVRQEDDLPPLPEGDVVLNSTYASYLGQKMMAAQQQQMGDGGEEGGESDDEENGGNEEDEVPYGGGGKDGGNKNPYDEGDESEENPFAKAFNDFVLKLNK